jgi:tetratricopeptide (TPR) repeat protein
VGCHRRSRAAFQGANDGAGCILANAGRFLGTNDGDYDAANEALERSLAIAREYGDTALERRALALAARVDWWHMRWEQCVARSTRALELAQAADDQQTELYARSWLVRDAATRGSPAEARDHAKACLELADRLRERYWVATARVNAFWLASLEGDWEAARSFSDAGLRVQPRDARNLGLRVLLEHELGEPGQGDLYAERLVEAVRATEAGSNVEHAEAAAVIALVGVITGRPERFGEAEAAAKTVLSASIRLPIFDVCARVGLGVIAVEQADAAAAREQYQELESQAGTLLILLGMAADRLLGLLSVAIGEVDTARAHFEAALAFCDHAGYRPEYARTALDYAGALVDRAAPGDSERATFLRDEGLSIVRELGMRALEERVTARGRAGGS